MILREWLSVSTALNSSVLTTHYSQCPILPRSDRVYARIFELCMRIPLDVQKNLWVVVHIVNFNQEITLFLLGMSNIWSEQRRFASAIRTHPYILLTNHYDHVFCTTQRLVDTDVFSKADVNFTNIFGPYLILKQVSPPS